MNSQLSVLKSNLAHQQWIGKQFKENPTKNPFTQRSIKINGPTHKKIIRQIDNEVKELKEQIIELEQRSNRAREEESANLRNAKLQEFLTHNAPPDIVERIFKEKTKQYAADKLNKLLMIHLLDNKSIYSLKNMKKNIAITTDKDESEIHTVHYFKMYHHNDLTVIDNLSMSLYSSEGPKIMAIVYDHNTNKMQMNVHMPLTFHEDILHDDMVKKESMLQFATFIALGLKGTMHNRIAQKMISNVKIHTAIENISQDLLTNKTNNLNFIFENSQKKLTLILNKYLQLRLQKLHLFLNDIRKITPDFR